MKKLIASFIAGAMILATAPMAFAATEAKEVVGANKQFSVSFSDGYTTEGDKKISDGAKIIAPTKSTVTITYTGKEKNWIAAYGNSDEDLYSISSEAKQKVLVKYFESKDAADKFFETSKDNDTIPVYTEADGIVMLKGDNDDESAYDLYLTFADTVTTPVADTKKPATDVTTAVADPAVDPNADPAVDPNADPAVDSTADPVAEPSTPVVEPTGGNTLVANPNAPQVPPTTSKEEPVVAEPTPVVAEPVPVVVAPVVVAPVVTTPAPTPVYVSALITKEGLVSAIPPSPVLTPDLKYTVQKGETFEGIAFNYYASTSGNTVAKIKAANADYLYSTRGILEAGAVISLPAKGLVNPITQSGLSNVGGLYLVQENDNLAKIAKTYYGNENLWKKIYNANKDRIKMVGKTPIIYDKQWLIIPN